MRRPFFSGNYGSALGSTANAANIIAQSGVERGRMFQQLGQQISSTLDKFRANKEKKEKEQRYEQQFVNLYEGNPGNPIFKNLGIQSTDEAKVVAKDISKDPQLIQQAMSFMQAANAEEQRKQQLQSQRMQRQLIKQNLAAGRRDNRQLNQTNRFLTTPGPPTLAPGSPDRNSVLRNLRAGKGVTPPARMIPGSSPAEQMMQSPEAKAFIQRAIKSEAPIQPAIKIAQQIDQRIAQSQPKALTPSENLALKKYEDQKAEDVKETETAKIESTNNLTDFYNETKSLLDKINEKSVDVTGPIEGTSIYRFFSKLGDTDDEQVRRRLEMFTRKLTLDAAQNLKGALSDKDIRFLVEQAPDMDDNPSVWKKYMGDLVLRLERNANQQGIKLGVPQADPFTPASQSLLDEIERKKQLRAKRRGM